MRLPRPKRNNKKKRERIMLNETYRAMLGHKLSLIHISEPTRP